MNIDEAILAAFNVDGLVSGDELRILAKLLPPVQNATVLEIGSWYGRSTTLWHSLGAKVFAIDSWSGEWVGVKNPVDHLAVFLKNTARGITPIKIDTIREYQEALVLVRFLFSARKADLVFIDAAHSYEGVRNDISLAKLAVAPGGIICGHDIDMDGVRKAVLEAYGSKWTQVSTKIWKA